MKTDSNCILTGTHLQLNERIDLKLSDCSSVNMFPILPPHMFNQSPASPMDKQLSLATQTCGQTIWSIWTEDIIKRKHLPINTANSIDKNLIDERKSTIKTEYTTTFTKRGCYARNYIPKGTYSKEFDEIIGCDKKSMGDIVLSVSALGVLESDCNVPEQEWIHRFNIAHDTYSNAALLEITPDRKLRINIVKNVLPDEEILLWFSEEVLVAMNIPFLSPANILGEFDLLKLADNQFNGKSVLLFLDENCYKCTECNSTYESPNPLKLHISKKCDRFSFDDLWLRLKQALSKLPMTTASMNQWPYLHPSNKSEIHQQVLRFQSENVQHNPSSLPIVQAYSPSHIQQFQRFSAFQPILFPSHHHSSNYHSTNILNIQSDSQPALLSQGSNVGTRSGLLPTTDKVVAAAAAQLETIVSNMGTSKQGHICIYCGKLYSRKYGLKIHIRTHTGFKPLKCKYCLRPFGDPSNLNKHIRLHVQEKSLYKCNLCAKILVRRRDLLRHMNIKHSARDSNPHNECDIEEESVSAASKSFNDTSSDSSMSDVNTRASTDADDDDNEDFERIDVD